MNRHPLRPIVQADIDAYARGGVAFQTRQPLPEALGRSQLDCFGVNPGRSD